jgi:hypothetical protein
VEDIIETGMVLQKALVSFLWSDEADQLNQGHHSPRTEKKLHIDGSRTQKNGTSWQLES